MLRFYKPSEAVHQGTFEDGHHKLQKMIFMITIESLVDMGANVRLEVTPTDLKMFAESIIQRTIVAQQEEQKAAIQREAEEDVYKRQTKDLYRQPLQAGQRPEPDCLHVGAFGREPCLCPLQAYR